MCVSYVCVCPMYVCPMYVCVGVCLCVCDLCVYVTCVCVCVLCVSCVLVKCVCMCPVCVCVCVCLDTPSFNRFSACGRYDTLFGVYVRCTFRKKKNDFSKETKTVLLDFSKTGHFAKEFVWNLP